MTSKSMVAAKIKEINIYPKSGRMTLKKQPQKSTPMKSHPIRMKSCNTPSDDSQILIYKIDMISK